MYYTDTHIHTHPHTHAHTRACTRTHTHTRKRTPTHAHTNQYYNKIVDMSDVDQIKHIFYTEHTHARAHTHANYRLIHTSVALVCIITWIS
jgi:hypothetical protein